MPIPADVSNSSWEIPRQQATVPPTIGEILPLVIARYGIYDSPRATEIVREPEPLPAMETCLCGVLSCRQSVLPLTDACLR